MLDPKLRSKIRQAFGVANQCVPIRIGDAVTLTGEDGGHFTRGGERIRHPNGYAKNGWSNMVYRTDTRVITITTHWLSIFIRSAKPYST